MPIYYKPVLTSPALQSLYEEQNPQHPTSEPNSQGPNPVPRSIQERARANGLWRASTQGSQITTTPYVAPWSESEPLSKNLSRSYNPTSQSKPRSRGSCLPLWSAWSLFYAMVLCMVAPLAMYFWYLRIQIESQPQQSQYSHWRSTRTVSTGMLLTLVLFSHCLITCNGYEVSIASIPYEEGKQLTHHNGVFQMPSLVQKFVYQIDKTCGIDTKLAITSGVECSPITEKVVDGAKWAHWETPSIGDNAHYVDCKYYRTHPFEYGCALASHQHCMALQVTSYSTIHFIHLSDSELLSDSSTSDVEVVPEQEYSMPHIAVADDVKFYENSESYATYHETECLVTIAGDNKIDINPNKMTVNYDLGSMHWSVSQNILPVPKHTTIPATKSSDRLIVHMKITPKTVTLLIRPPDTYDKECSLQCYRSSEARTTSVYDYHGDNLVTVVASSKNKLVCQVRNGLKIYYIHSDQPTRVGIGESKIITDSSSANCPYVKVKDWSRSDKTLKSDFIAGFGVNLGGLGDKMIAIVLCALVAYTMGPSITTLVLVAIIAFNSGLIVKAEAISVPHMHRGDSIGTTVEIIVLLTQIIYGKSITIGFSIVIPLLITVIFYPYRSEKVNLISFAKTFIAFVGDWALIRIPIYFILLKYRYSPSLHHMVRQALQKAEDTKNMVMVTTDENTPPIYEHSIEGALARIRLIRDHGKPGRRYFINRPVVNRIRPPGYVPKPRPIIAISRVRQVSGIVFYPEEYEIIRKHIKRMSTPQVIALKASATWVHGRSKWDFSEVIPYSPKELAEDLSQLSTV